MNGRGVKRGGDIEKRDLIVGIRSLGVFNLLGWFHYGLMVLSESHFDTNRLYRVANGMVVSFVVLQVGGS